MKQAMVQLQTRPLEPGGVDHALTLARTLRELPFELNLWQAQNIWYDTLIKSNRFLLGLDVFGCGALAGELPRVGTTALDCRGATGGGRRFAGRAGTGRLDRACAFAAQGSGSVMNSSASASPAQRDRAVDWMLHSAACFFGL